MRAALLVLVPACTVMPAADAPTSPVAAAPAEAPSGPAPAGSVERPGGPLRQDQTTCDAAHDHCLRDGTWFAMRTQGDDRVHPVFLHGDRWFDWDSLGEIAVVEAYRTRAATAADVTPGVTVLFYKSSLGPSYGPGSEAEAYADWRIDTVASVDGDAGTFEWGSGSMDVPIENARVIVETR